MTAVDMQVRLWGKESKDFHERAARLGMDAGDIIAAFITAIIREDDRLQQWWRGQAKNNFLSYLADKGKLAFIIRLMDKADSCWDDISSAYAMGSKDKVKENMKKSEACWTLIWKEYDAYKDVNPHAMPLQDELQAVTKWIGVCNGRTKMQTFDV